MGSKKSSTSILSNSNQNVEALAEQNKQIMEMFKVQSENQRTLFQQQSDQLNSLNAGVISGQKTVLDEQQQATRNTEIRNRAAGAQSANDALESQSVAMQSQRLRDKQTNQAQNQATRESNNASLNSSNFISDFIRRQRMFAQ